MEKKRSGCFIAAVAISACLLAGAVGVGVLIYFSADKAKRVMNEMAEARQAELDREMARNEKLQPVELNETQLPAYALYQPGDMLDRAMFLAWRVDERATSLARESFRGKIEGAEISWLLWASDVREQQNGIIGSFYLQYVVVTGWGTKRSGVEEVQCEFAPVERESLLSIRRDELVEIRGKLSLESGKLVIRDARLVGAEVEK